MAYYVGLDVSCSRSFCIACGSTGRRRLLRSEGNTETPARTGGKRRPCWDDGDDEFARFFASVREADRDFNIEPPASTYAIMRRVHPYRGENSGPGKDDRWRA
jgi:hypothetical protein